MKKNCKCGLLASLAHWGATPVMLHHETCLLTLAQGKEVELSYCPHCAGESRKCRCGALAAWSDEAPEVVRYDPDSGEYRLAVGEMEVPFRFCPCCGGALRAPGLDEDRSGEELRYFARLVSEARNLDEVINILGQPDVHSGTARLLEGRSPNQPNAVGRSLEFSHVSQYLRIIIQELANGSLQVSFCGKSGLQEDGS